MASSKQINRRKKGEPFWSRYYEPQEPWPFAVRSVGYNRYQPGDRNPNLKHPYHHWHSEKSGRVLDTLTIVHVVRGAGMFRSGPSGELKVAADSLFVVFPKVNHYYKCDVRTGWDDEWAELSAESVLPLLAAAGVTPERPLLSGRPLAEVADALQRLLDLARADADESSLSLAAHRVVAETVRAWRRTDSATEAVARLRQSLSSDLSDVGRVTAAETQLGGSPSRLRAAFKAVTGLSPKRYHTKLRLDRAAELLRASKLPVAEIAERLGFNSPSVFSRQFTAATGRSPREYRAGVNGEKLDRARSGGK